MTSKPAGSIQDRFEQFHLDNPWVLAKLIELIEQLRRQGRQRYGIGMLWEVLRWKVAMGTITVPKDFKFNNNYRSRYVRLICKVRPDLASMFEMRELRAE